MPQPPIGHELNVTMQAVLLYGSWALTIVVLAIAIQMGRRERTPFYVIVVVAVMVGAFVEPLYDTAMMLYFYSTTGMITHFTAFGVPQPLWTHSGYVVLYASVAIFVARSSWQGTLTRKRLYVFAGVEFAMSCAFEMIGIRGNTYAYWGPHVLRVFDYPLAIGALEASQVVVFAMAADLLRRRVTRSVGLLALFVLFPCAFLMANFGAGWPMIIALHLDQPSTSIVMAGSLVSIALGMLLIRAAAGVVRLPVPVGSTTSAVDVEALPA
jgi:hypothetical protein